MQYKYYNVQVFGGAICILIAIASLCYRADPANIFRNELVETCGEWLLQGHDIAITQNYDERLLQKYLIEHGTKNYDVLVLGSSRTMDIGTNLFEQRTFHNYSVSGASIEDDIALYFYYERLHGKPQKVILGADAWLLNVNNDQKRWKSLEKEYEYGIGRMEDADKKGSAFESKTIDWEKYAQLISWSYLNEAIINKRSGYCLADDKTALANNMQIICSDGSIFRSGAMSAADAEPKARQYISGNVYSLNKYEILDAALKEKIKATLSYMKAKDIEVVLYLTPYHPIVYSYLRNNEKYKIVLDAEKFFREVADEYGVIIVGSYDPEQYGLSNEDFLDGMHMRRESVERMLWGKL